VLDRGEYKKVEELLHDHKRAPAPGDDATKCRAGVLRDPGPHLPRHLRLARHLKEADFVPLYIRYRVADSLRCAAARTISDFLAGLHSLPALPRGEADQLATLEVTEGDKPCEPVLLLQ
jgi:hypothetical protein